MDAEDDCSVVTSGFVDTLVSDNLRSRATGFLLTFDLNDIFLMSRSLSLSDESGGGATCGPSSSDDSRERLQVDSNLGSFFVFVLASIFSCYSMLFEILYIDVSDLDVTG
jgi:hypothetical protein